MITVRFPNGQAVVYNNANFVHSHSEYTNLYTKKDGVWIAQVPNTCLIEAQPPCRVHNAMQESSLKELTASIEAIRRKMNQLAKPTRRRLKGRK